jgi:4-methylaminobutanoate oxidase (formaldehyde-forming)
MAGGVGWAMADWITKGSPELDVSNFDIRRFTRSQNNLRTLSRRIPDVLAHHHAIPWPGHDYMTVRNLRRSPFHSVMNENGAFFGERGGWERPIWFAGKGSPAPQRDDTFGKPAWFGRWAGEHRAARDSVAIFDGSPLAKILVQGRDAPSFLNRMMTQDVDMPVGTARYSLMLNERGGILSDPMVCRIGETTYFITTGSGQGLRDATWLRRHVRSDEIVVVTDVSSAYATLMVAGPASRQLVASFSSDDFSNDAFPHGAARDVEIAHSSALAIRFSYTGELGFELHIASDAAQSVLEDLLCGTKGSRPCLAGLAALNSLRIEKGFRSWGHDIGPSDRPGESGLSFAVRLKKADEFIGKAAVLRERKEPASRRLVSFVFSDESVFPHGEEAIYRNGQPCGALTSASFGHTVGAPVGLGWIERGPTGAEAVLADRFEVEVVGDRYAVTPHLEAPYDPLRQRPLA